MFSAKCEDLASQVDGSTMVVGYRDPAVEGTNVTFSCPPGLVLTRPDISTCMRNGEWEPNPGEIKCLGGHLIHMFTA